MLAIRGENNFDAVHINIILKPCLKSKNDECVEYDFQEFNEYLGYPDFVLYQNT